MTALQTSWQVIYCSEKQFAKHNIHNSVFQDLCFPEIIINSNSQKMLTKLMFFILKNKFPIKKWGVLIIVAFDAFYRFQIIQECLIRKKPNVSSSAPLVISFSEPQETIPIIRSGSLTAVFPQPSPSQDVQRPKIAILFPLLSM